MGTNYHKPRPLLERFLGKVNKNGPIQAHVPEIGNCWEWTAYRNADGYGKIGVGIRAEKTRRTEQAHRVSWFLHTGEWPTALVLHKCDNRLCVRPSHLFLGTDADNNADMVSKGRSRRAKGDRNGQSKLTDDEAMAIFERRKSGERPCDLAREFGISRSHASSIGKTRWQHLANAGTNASQPAAETQTPKPDPPVSLPIITGPMTDVPGDPYKLTGPQTPDRDVEGLARALREYATKRGMAFDWKGQAEAVFAFLDGGPST